MYTNHSISCTSITPLPDEHTWAQVYHAGNLTVLLVLTDTDPESTSTALAKKGQQILHHIESEFFSLQTKTVPTIEKIAQATLTEHANHMQAFSLVVTAETMCLCNFGASSITLVRNGSAGKLLGESEKLQVIAGKREPGDAILIATSAFTQLIPLSESMHYMYLDDEGFAEHFTTTVHEAQNPQAACARLLVAAAEPDEPEESEEPEKPLIIHHHEETQTPLPEREEREEEHEEPKIQISPRRAYLPTHRKRLLWTITIIIAITFCISIFFYLHTSASKKNQNLFQQSVVPLEKTITDAQAIASVNPTQATSQIADAKKKLEALLPQFPADSDEYKQVQHLLAQLASQTPTGTPLTIASHPSPLLQYLNTHTDSTAGFEDTQAFYIVTQDTITRTNKQSQKQDTLITNKSTWENAESIVIYNNNVYVLSTQDLLKFVPTGTSYTKSSYLQQTTDLSQATRIAVDTSMWIGMRNGSIQKYTKGKPDTFTLSSSMGKPQTISYLFTTPDISNLYALDQQSGLLFVIAKTGAVTKTIPVANAANIQAATLLPDGSQIQVLIQGQVYQIPVQ